MASLAVFLLCLPNLGCSVIKGKPQVINDIEAKLNKKTPSSEPEKIEYKTIEESDTFKVVSVDPHEDLKALRRTVGGRS